MAKQAKRLASKEAKVDNAKTSEGGVVFEDVDGSMQQRALSPGERLTPDHLERMGEFLPDWIEAVRSNSNSVKWSAAKIVNQLVLINTLVKSKALIKACQGCPQLMSDGKKPFISKATDRLPETTGSRHQKLTRLLVFVSLEAKTDCRDHGDTSALWGPEDMENGLSKVPEKTGRSGGTAGATVGAGSVGVDSCGEERGREEEGAEGRREDALLLVSMQQGEGADEEEEGSGRGEGAAQDEDSIFDASLYAHKPRSEGCVHADPINDRAAGKAPAPRRTSTRANRGSWDSFQDTTPQSEGTPLNGKRSRTRPSTEGTQVERSKRGRGGKGEIRNKFCTV